MPSPKPNKSMEDAVSSSVTAKKKENMLGYDTYDDTEGDIYDDDDGGEDKDNHMDVNV
jgi:hypothetical protein